MIAPETRHRGVISESNFFHANVTPVLPGPFRFSCLNAAPLPARGCAGRRKVFARRFSRAGAASMDFQGLFLHILPMSALLFDTLRLSRTLRDKGHFTSEQAETLAEALGEVAHDDLATKADLAALKADLKTDIVEAKADILKWVVGAIGFQTVVILGALVSLVRIFAK